MSNYLNVFRSIELETTDNTVCTCPENPDVNEFGDNSWLPCMEDMYNGTLNYPELTCKKCVYCNVIEK